MYCIARLFKDVQSRINCAAISGVVELERIWLFGEMTATVFRSSGQTLLLESVVAVHCMSMWVIVSGGAGEDEQRRHWGSESLSLAMFAKH